MTRLLSKLIGAAPASNEPICRNCRFWKPPALTGRSAKVGQCKPGPPPLVKCQVFPEVRWTNLADIETHPAAGVWPVTPWDETCPAFRPCEPSDE